MHSAPGTHQRRCPFPECLRVTTWTQVNEKVFLPGRSQRAAPPGTAFRCLDCGHNIDRIEFERLPKHNCNSRFRTTGVGGEGHTLVGNTIRHTDSHNKVLEEQAMWQSHFNVKSLDSSREKPSGHGNPIARNRPCGRDRPPPSNTSSEARGDPGLDQRIKLIRAKNRAIKARHLEILK